MSESQFLLPDVGEGLTEAEIVSWRVAPGRHRRRQPGARRDRDREVARRAAVAVRGRRRRAARGRGRRRSRSARRSSPCRARRATAPRPPSRSARPTRPPRTPRRASRSDDEPAPSSRAPCSSATARGHGAAAPACDASGHGAIPCVATARRAAPPSAAAHAAQRRSASRCARGGVTPSVPVIAKPPDPQARQGPRRRPRDRSPPPAPIGEVTREDVMREATQASVFRNIQTPEWPNDREDRIPVKGVRKAIANAMVTQRVHRPARQPVRRRRRDAHDGVRQAAEGLARLRRRARCRRC